MPKPLLIMRSVLVQSLRTALTDVVTGTGRRHHFHGKRRAVDMWNYEKRLEYPINIKQTNPALAAMIISQYGGPDGELGASMRYISQRYTMPDRAVAGLLTDIGTEESAHLCCILYFQINFQIILIHVIVGIIIILYFTYKTF